MTSLSIRGAKSGAGSAPTQAPDTLSSVTYAQILDLISEGPIFGAPSGSPAQSVYLNDVPLQNADGSYNFTIDGFDFRYGEVDQTYIPGFASSQQETSVGVELKQVTPWNMTVTDLTINTVIVTLGVSSLSSTDPNSGDVNGYEVAYQIQLSVDGGAFSTVVSTSFNGKCTSAYQRSHKIAVYGAASQYQIRVVRTTADTTSVYIQDTTTVVSYTLVVDAKLRYPFSAVAALSVDAVQFSSVPTRSYWLRGLLVNVPSNYDPTARTYSGTWDGTFKTAWTDNPAWVFYDLVLNNRYGLGQWVSATMVDRFSLYQIAQYCDVMVSDGAGGQEPRFTCNCYIATRADAIKVIQDLASIFRGMAYWGAGAVVATADMPSDPVYVYTAANIVGGQFKYVGSALKNRYTAAAITWNDPSNSYKQAVEYVEDADGIARYGLNEAQITAFGCTSRGQAQRAGHWLLLTSRYETDTVTFSVGLDGTLCMPGQVIAVADASRAGKRIAGRLNAVASAGQVTLDKPMDGVATGDTLTVIMPNGVAAQSTITTIDSTGAEITVSPPLPSAPVAGAVWMIESAALESQLFRVASVTEKDGIQFEVTGTQYEPAKYAAIDGGAAFTPRPTVGNSFTTQVPPTGVTCLQYVTTSQGFSQTNLTISWTAAANATSYTVQWQKDNGAWVTAGTTGQTSIDVASIYSGNYTARVLATNGMGISSVYAYSTLTALTGKTGAPPAVATFTASTNVPFAINLSWTFPSGAGDTAYTEIYYGTTNSFSNAVQLGRYSYPTNTTTLQGLAAGASLFFWARLVDTTGNIGAWFPSSTAAGVNGQSSSDATAILTYLTAQITSSQLAQDVLSPIQAIPGLSSTVAANTANIQANAAAISQEVTDRANAITAEATARQAAITSEASTRQAADSSLSQQITTLTASVNANTSGIQTEQTARANGDAANAASITALTSTVNSNTAAIQNEASTRASADSAQASQIAQLQAVTFVPMAGDNGTSGDAAGFAGATTVYAGVYSEQSARTDADNALANSVSVLSSSFTNSLAAANASITSEASTRASADSVLSSQITTLSASVNANTAAIQTEQTARASGDAANASSIATVQAQVSTNAAAIQNEATARAAGDSANASQIATVQSSLNTTNSTVSSLSSTVQTNYNTYASFANGVNASYTIKTQVSSNGQTYIAGIGVGVNAGGGTVSSQVLVAASQFAVIDPNGVASNVSPFVIQGGQVFMNQALIGNAWITNAMIANGSINNAQIQSGAIGNAQIQSAAISQAQIQSGAIGSAQIQNAAIQTAHIGQAQVDTLLLGANAATSTAAATSSGSIGGSYQCSGGSCAVFVVVNNGTGTIVINFAGTNIGASGSYGCNMRLVSPGAGTVNWTVSSNSAVSSFSVVVMEFKR